MVALSLNFAFGDGFSRTSKQKRRWLSVPTFQLYLLNKVTCLSVLYSFLGELGHDHSE